MSSFSYKGSLTMKKYRYEAFVNKEYRTNQFLELTMVINLLQREP